MNKERSTELLLLRHGKSDWSFDVPDIERPLSDRGKRDAQRVGNYLRVNGIEPDLVVASPARRAWDTAEKCIKAAGLTTGIIKPEEDLYEASVRDILSVIKAASSSADRLMIVGHNPGFDFLLETLVDEPLDYTKDGKLITTANLVRLQLNDSNQATLIEHIRPSTLPEKFYFETEGGSEERDRPQYYYTQSGAIPWRQGKNGIEVLLIGNRSGKKWSVPKGIVEPGLTAWESAAKEAEEEAGVIGVVSDQVIGQFEINKWGANCYVSVYPMEVKDLMPKGEWESHKRQRKWYSMEEAIKRVRYSELGRLIRECLTSAAGDV